VEYRAVLQNLRTLYTLKLPHLREELTKQLPLKDRKKKKTGKTPRPPGETKTEPLLKY
jgi:hypothetical protein